MVRPTALQIGGFIAGDQWMLLNPKLFPINTWKTDVPMIFKAGGYITNEKCTAPISLRAIGLKVKVTVPLNPTIISDQ